MTVSAPLLQHLSSFVLQWSLMAAILAWALRHLFRTGRFLSSVLRLWIGLSAWGILLCLVMPIAVWQISGPGDSFLYFPEGPGAVGMVCGGWIPALFICGVAYGLRALWLYLRSRRAPRQVA